MSNKDKFISFCQSNQSIPIFMQYWWLDAVSGDNWDVILMEENNKIIAFLPYFLHKKYCFKSIIPPHLTPIGGIWLSYEKGMHQTSRYTHEIKVMDFIAKEIDKLKIDFFSQKFNHKITNWLGFYWNGFKQTTCYTYRINDLENIDLIYQNIASKKRRIIRNAEENIVIDNEITNEKFYEILSMSFKRQGLNMPYSYSLFERIEKECSQRQRSSKLVAKDKQGNIEAVMYLVFDETTCYTLASGADPKYRDSGAMALLNWKAMELAHKMGKKEFDFTGSMMQNVEKFFRFYGATLTPYFLIEKNYSKLYSLLRSLKH